jgi:hypothetical protein
MNSFEFTTRRRASFLGFAIATVFSFASPIANTTSDATEVAPALDGRWSGKIQIPSHELTLIIDLAHDQNWRGSAILPGLNVKGAPLTDIKTDGADLSFGIQALTSPGVEPPRIKAHLTEKKLVGDFVQAGNTAHFELDKTGPPQVDEIPHSTAVAKEFEGEWTGGYDLLGYPRKVTLKLQNHDSQPASAEWVIVGRKINNLPVDRITQQGKFITVQCSAFEISYEGRLEKGELQGTVFQGPIEVGLVMRRPK